MTTSRGVLFGLGLLGLLAIAIFAIVGERGGRTAVLTEPAPVPVSREEAFDLHRQQRWPQAIAAYDALVKTAGEDPEILYWRGMAHWKSAHFDEAYRDFRRVIEIDPAHLEAHRGAHRLLERQKKWDEIVAMWSGYISRQPANADGYFERGEAHASKGDTGAARADAAKACQLGKAQACKMLERLQGP